MALKIDKNEQKARKLWPPQVGVDGALLFGASMALKIGKNEQKARKLWPPPSGSRWSPPLWRIYGTKNQQK